MLIGTAGNATGLPVLVVTVFFLIRAEFRKAQRQGHIRPGVKPEFLMVFLDILADLAVDERLVRLYPSPKELGSELMNLFFYLAIDRIDLGKAVTIEFIGPIAVAAVATRSVRNAVALLFAVAGVVVLGGGEIEGNAIGLLFIGAAQVGIPAGRKLTGHAAPAWSVADWLRGVHPDDRTRLQQALDQARSELADAEIQLADLRTPATELQIAQADLAIQSLADGVRKYAGTWRRLDGRYRKFIYHYRAANQVPLLQPLFEQVENLYSDR